MVKCTILLPFLTENSFNNQVKLTNQSFCKVFVMAAPKIDWFANPVLNIDRFGRTRQTRSVDITINWEVQNKVGCFTKIGRHILGAMSNLG